MQELSMWQLLRSHCEHVYEKCKRQLDFLQSTFSQSSRDMVTNLTPTDVTRKLMTDRRFQLGQPAPDSQPFLPHAFGKRGPHTSGSLSGQAGIGCGAGIEANTDYVSTGYA